MEIELTSTDAAVDSGIIFTRPLWIGDVEKSLCVSMLIDGQCREVCRFQIIDGALDIKVPDDLPMTRAARAFLATVKQVYGF